MQSEFFERDSSGIINSFVLFFFFYLSALGPSYGTWDLQSFIFVAA